MTYNLIGRFYFKQTINGNLIGEFSNYESDEKQKISTESCDLREMESRDLRKSSKDNYVGMYLSTWQEGGTPHFADLTITTKPRNDRLFSLEWRDKRGTLIFEGEGMLCDDILIGDYHSNP